jgi:DNA repair protein RecN (Recombination protein N)
MLQHLHLKNFIIVKSLDLDVRQGFTVLTGETGAGKSILLDALGLLLGDRTDSGVVAQGSDKAEISAEFTVSKTVQDWLSDAGFDADDELLLRRVIDAQGKSRAFINGSAATLTQLRELGEQLVNIHGQHAHQQLLKAHLQRDLLDDTAKLHNECAAVRSTYQTWQHVREALTLASERGAQLVERLDTLEWQLDELNQLAPQSNEWETLSSEHSRLSHAATLLQTCGQAAEVLDGEDHDVVSQLRDQINKLTDVLEYDDRLNEYVELLESACIQVQEAAHSLNNYAQRADMDESNFAELDARLSLWHSTARKLRIAPESLAEHADALNAEFDQLQHGLDIEQLQRDAELAEQAYRSAAKKLSTARKKSAKELSAQVSASMQLLNMSGGQFDIAIHDAAPSSHGSESIEFKVAAHTGVPLQALAKVASGGELARIALAISVITSHANPVPTLIFDEVDSGIGGAVAEVVGKLLRQLGSDRQVLCVTHLPQVAALGTQHWRVQKSSDAGTTQSSIDVLNDAERIDEIARMLGGVELTDTTRAHAREMLMV